MPAAQVFRPIQTLPPRGRAMVAGLILRHGETPNATTRKALREDLSKARRFDWLEVMMANLKS